MKMLSNLRVEHVYMYVYMRANGIYIPKCCNLQHKDSLSLFLPESTVINDALVPQLNGPRQVQWTHIGVLQLQLMFVKVLLRQVGW